MLGEKEVDAMRRMHRGGKSLREIASIFCRDRKTVTRAMASKRTTVTRRPSAAIRARRDAAAKLAGKKNGRTCAMFPSCSRIARELKKQGHKASASTVRRDLVAKKFSSFVRRYVPSADPKALAKRTSAARRLLRLDLQKLRFSDESYMTCDNHTHRRQWVRRKEELLPRQRQQRGAVPFCMVWGVVGHGYKSKLLVFKRKKLEDDEGSMKYGVPKLNAAAYVRRCLSTVARALKGTIFVHDGARPHTAKRTQKYLQRKKLVVFEGWAPHSPDMNVIEHVWALMKPLVAEAAPKTDDELVAACHAAWAAVPQATIDSMVAKHRRVLRAVEASRGKYD
jgi:transposase